MKLSKALITLIGAGCMASTAMAADNAIEPMHVNVKLDNTSDSVVVYKVSPTFGYASSVNEEVNAETDSDITLYPDNATYINVTYNGEAARLYASGVISFYSVNEQGTTGSCQQSYKIVQPVNLVTNTLGTPYYVLQENFSNGDVACDPGTDPDNWANPVVDYIDVGY